MIYVQLTYKWYGRSCNNAVCVSTAPRLLLVGGNRGGVCDDAVGVAAAPGFLLVCGYLGDDGGDGGESVHYEEVRGVGEQVDLLRLKKQTGAGCSLFYIPAHRSRPKQNIQQERA